MAFLRKWGTSAAGNPAVNPSSSNGIGGAGGIGTGGKDGAPIEWHNETPGERYFGMENVSSFPRFPPIGTSGRGFSSSLSPGRTTIAGLS